LKGEISQVSWPYEEPCNPPSGHWVNTLVPLSITISAGPTISSGGGGQDSGGQGGWLRKKKAAGRNPPIGHFNNPLFNYATMRGGGPGAGEQLLAGFWSGPSPPPPPWGRGRPPPQESQPLAAFFENTAAIFFSSLDHGKSETKQSGRTLPSTLPPPHRVQMRNDRGDPKLRPSKGHTTPQTRESTQSAYDPKESAHTTPPGNYIPKHRAVV